MRLKWTLLLACVALLIFTGCSSNKGPSQKEMARQKWNRARAQVMHGLAKDQYATGNFEPARKTTDQAMRMDPTNAPLRVLSAKLAIEAGQLDLAERELERARQLNPRDPEADYLSGVVYQRWQKPETALSFYSSASEKDPNELAYLLAKSEMLVVMGRQEEALRLLQERVVYFEHSAVIRDAVGQLLMQFKKYEQAAESFRQAGILATNDLTIQEHLGLALYFAGNYSDAVFTLQRLVKNEQYAKRADLQLALGRSLLEIGKVREARHTLETASQLDPSNAAVWLSLGTAALNANDLRRAELSLRRAQAYDPDSSEVRLMMGYLRLKQGRLEEALASFQRAAILDREDTVSLCMVGYVLQKMGREEEAARYYAKALRMKPGDDMAKKLMASIAD